jgi:hypothetical protein
LRQNSAPAPTHFVLSSSSAPYGKKVGKCDSATLTGDRTRQEPRLMPIIASRALVLSQERKFFNNAAPGNNSDAIVMRSPRIAALLLQKVSLLAACRHVTLPNAAATERR